MGAVDSAARDAVAIGDLGRLAEALRAWSERHGIPLYTLVHEAARPYLTLVVQVQVTGGYRAAHVLAGREHFWYMSGDWVLGNVSQPALVAAKLGDLVTGRVTLS